MLPRRKEMRQSIMQQFASVCLSPKKNVSPDVRFRRRMAHISPIGGGSDADNEIYLRYYADDATRRAGIATSAKPFRRKMISRPYRSLSVAATIHSAALAERVRLAGAVLESHRAREVNVVLDVNVFVRPQFQFRQAPV